MKWPASSTNLHKIEVDGWKKKTECRRASEPKFTVTTESFNTILKVKPFSKPFWGSVYAWLSHVSKSYSQKLPSQICLLSPRLVMEKAFPTGANSAFLGLSKSQGETRTSPCRNDSPLQSLLLGLVPQSTFQNSLHSVRMHFYDVVCQLICSFAPNSVPQNSRLGNRVGQISGAGPHGS